MLLGSLGIVGVSSFRYEVRITAAESRDERGQTRCETSQSRDDGIDHKVMKN